MSYYIYDIDGTLADTSDRVQFVRPPADWPSDKKFKKDWKSFFDKKRMLADPPIIATVLVAQMMMHSEGIPPVYCTGRPSEYRQVSVEWLAKNVEIDSSFESISSRLFMRSFNDHRDDSVVKPELVQQIVEKYGQPLAMFEDRNRVVNAVRALGVRVFQVADGAF